MPVRVKELGFQNSLVLMDVFKAHFAHEISATMLLQLVTLVL